MTFEILIRGGTVFDGVGDEGIRADVGIAGGAIKAVGNLTGSRALHTVEADGLFICPGFIDIQNHSDSYLTLLENPTQESLIRQGITTIAVGHCGASLAPLPNPEALRSVQKWRSLAGANLNWLTFAEYLENLRRYPLGVNVLSLVGHATLRRGLLRDQIRAATKEEIAIMQKLLRESFEAGAGGLSLGLMYAHEIDSPREELLSLLEIAAARNLVVSCHLRSEGSNIIAALQEAVELAKQSRVRFKISHFKIRNRLNWSYLEEALAILDRAYQSGTDISFDVYPYTTSWNVLYTYLPKWSYEGGKKVILQNLADPARRSKIVSYLKSLEQNLGNIFVANSETNPMFVGKTMAEIAANQSVSVEEAVANVVAATAAQAVVFDHNLSSQVLEIFLKHPLSMIGSDGAGHDFHFSSSQGLLHPRCFGTFPKFLSMVREQKLMSWSAAIKKITSRPAEKLGLKKLGRITPGMAADVVGFGPQGIGSRASYENPYVPPDGIDFVILNGQIVWQSRQEDEVKAAGQVLAI